MRTCIPVILVVSGVLRRRLAAERPCIALVSFSRGLKWIPNHLIRVCSVGLIVRSLSIHVLLPLSPTNFVMLLLNGIQAWIEVEGVELKQYAVENSPNGTMTCWIACEEGKNFSVFWKDTAPRRGPGATISGRVTVDGHRCGGKLSSTGHPDKTLCKSGVSTSDTSIRPFLFSALELTDDDNYLVSSAATKDLGDISLEVWDVLRKGRCDRRRKDIPSDHQKIHERSKKSLAHCVKFGAEKQVKEKPSFDVQDLSCRATFIFRYRSINILMANGIVPIPPSGKKRAAEESPEPKQDSDEEGDTNDEELRALEERMKAIKAIKTKRNRKKKIKTENVKTKFVPGEIIDLT